MLNLHGLTDSKEQLYINVLNKRPCIREAWSYKTRHRNRLSFHQKLIRFTVSLKDTGILYSVYPFAGYKLSHLIKGEKLL